MRHARRRVLSYAGTRSVEIPVMRNTISDYDALGDTYSGHRRPDPVIQSHIETELGDARTVLNVGAGPGSYEPLSRYVVAIEPSVAMRRQRPPTHSPALIATADSIPFDDLSFDAAMAVLTIHHWPNLGQGLREVRRVTKGPVVIMTFDPDAETEFWLADYLPEMTVVEKARYPSLNVIEESIGSWCKVVPIPVTLNCNDKFQVALYGRPEEFLKQEVRDSQSAWKFLPDGAESRFVEKLSHDIASGGWDEKYGHLRTKPTIDCQLRLVVSEQEQTPRSA